MFKVTKVYQKTDSIFLGMTADNDPAILHFPMTGKTYKTVTYVYKIGSLNEMHTMKDVRKYLNTYGLTLKKF